jgi:flavodoxin
MYMLDHNDPLRKVIAYPVGRQVGMRDLGTNTMKFLKSPDQDFIEVTSLGYSKTKKNVVVGFIKQGDKRAYVGIHQVKNGDQKFKCLMTLDLLEG